MFYITHLNRWFVWVIVGIFSIFILTWWQVLLFSSEQDLAANTSLAVYHKTKVAQATPESANAPLSNGLMVAK